MEAFGRTIALVVGIIGVVFLLLFSKTASVRWQRHESVRNMSFVFAEQLLGEKEFSFREWEVFRKEIANLGGYRAELTVYEGRRSEDENGGFYLYRQAEITENMILKEGSYVRLVVTTEERSDGTVFLFGDYESIVVGGRV